MKQTTNFDWKNVNDVSLNLWYGLCEMEKEWKEEDRLEDYDEIVAEYERRQQLDKELEDANE